MDIWENVHYSCIVIRIVIRMYYKISKTLGFCMFFSDKCMCYMYMVWFFDMQGTSQNATAMYNKNYMSVCACAYSHTCTGMALLFINYVYVLTLLSLHQFREYVTV